MNKGYPSIVPEGQPCPRMDRRKLNRTSKSILSFGVSLAFGAISVFYFVVCVDKVSASERRKVGYLDAGA